MAIQRECLLVGLDRLGEPPPLHQQLGIRIVRIRIVWNQLHVLLERDLGVVQLVEEAIGIAKLVVRLRERRVDGRRLDECLHRRVVVLAAEVEVAEQRVGPFIVREQSDELGVVRQHLRDVAFHRRVEPEHHVLLAVADPPGQRRRAGDGVDEFLGRSGSVREAEMGQGEIGVLGDRLFVESPRICRPKLFRELASL